MLPHSVTTSEPCHGLATSRGRRAVVALAALTLGGAAVTLGGTAQPALAAKPVTVCPTGCDFAGIQDAIGAVGVGGTIQIAAGTYPGSLTVDKSLTLVGAGAGQTTIGGGVPAVVSVSPNVVATFKDVTITSGFPDRAAGIHNDGSLTLINATISGNQDFDVESEGAGILNRGTVTLKGSTVSRNAAGTLGGGIYNEGGTVTLNESTVSNNRAEDGGGIFTVGGTVTVSDSLISTNSAADGGSGGGINKNVGGTLSVRGSTISGNSAQGFGGGIYSADNQLMVRDTTISGNAARCGGGIAVTGALTFALRDNTISGNFARAPFEDIFNPPVDTC